MTTYLDGIAVNPKLFDNIENGIAQPAAPYIHVDKTPEPVHRPRRVYYHYHDIRRHVAGLAVPITAANYRKQFAPNANYYGIHRVLKAAGKLQMRGQS